MQKKLMIIDGNSLLYRGFYAMPLLSTADGQFTNAVYSFVTILTKAIEDIKPDYLVVAFDYGKKTFRNDLFEDYKAGRRETPEELKPQFPLIKKVLDTMGIKYLEKQGIEADDIIATVAKKSGIQNIILTGDRDSFQLIDDNTSIYFMKKGISEVKIIDEKTLKDDYGIKPSQVVDVKALMGDKSDNILGVKGVGETTAYKLIIEYGTLDSVYENLANLTSKLKEKLENDKESAYLSYKLAQNVIDDELKFNIEDFEYEFPYSFEVEQLFKKLEFKTLLKRSNLFALEKRETVNANVIILDNKKDIIDVAKKLKLQQECVFYACETYVSVLLDNIVYKILVSEDVSLDRLNRNDVLELFKTVLEDEKILKIVFDLKELLHLYDFINVEVNNVIDCNIAKYLLQSTLKSFVVDDLCNDFSTNEPVVALNLAKEEYLVELEKFGLSKLYFDVELPLCKVLYNMEKTGVKIDVEILKEFDKKLSLELEEVENLIYTMAGHKFNIKSPKQVGELLYDELKLADNVKKKSTNIDNLHFLQDRHEIVPLIIKHRKLIKLKNTYIDSYFKFEKEGFIHCQFNQTATDTGRLSSTNPNLQNIPVKDDDSKFIREVFVSRFKDGIITSFDYDQIELKLMAHMSGDETMIRAFNDGKDIHKSTASKIYGVAECDVTKQQRRNAKAVNFGIIYGQGAFGLSSQLGISIKEASDFIEKYFETFPQVKDYMSNTIKNAIQNNNTAITLFGRRRTIPELTIDNVRLRQAGERIAINMPLQGSASDIIKIAMIKVEKMLKENNMQSKLVLQIHDELVFDTKPEELELLIKNVKEIMENIVQLKVPLTVSVNYGENLLKS